MDDRYGLQELIILRDELEDLIDNPKTDKKLIKAYKQELANIKEQIEYSIYYRKENEYEGL